MSGVLHGSRRSDGQTEQKPKRHGATAGQSQLTFVLVLPSWGCSGQSKMRHTVPRPKHSSKKPSDTQSHSTICIFNSSHASRNLSKPSLKLLFPTPVLWHCPSVIFRIKPGIISLHLTGLINFNSFQMYHERKKGLSHQVILLLTQYH